MGQQTYIKKTSIANILYYFLNSMEKIFFIITKWFFTSIILNIIILAKKIYFNNLFCVKNIFIAFFNFFSYNFKKK
jgi:hypothetical protein